MSKEEFSIYWPGTDIVKSRNNGFTMGLRRSDDEWRGITASAAMKAASTSQVERSRKDLGVDPGAFYGISKKSDERVRHGAFTRVDAAVKPKGPRGPAVGYGLQPDSKTGVLRSLIAGGPKTGAELAQGAGVKRTSVASLLKHDLRRKRIVKIVTPGSVLRYALPEAA